MGPQIIKLIGKQHLHTSDFSVLSNFPSAQNLLYGILTVIAPNQFFVILEGYPYCLSLFLTSLLSELQIHFSGVPVFSVYEMSVTRLDAPTQSQKDWIPHCNDTIHFHRGRFGLETK